MPKQDVGEYENTVGQVGEIRIFYPDGDVQLLSVADAAIFFSVSERTILRYLEAGQLIGIKIARDWFVQTDNVVSVATTLDNIPF